MGRLGANPIKLFTAVIYGFSEPTRVKHLLGDPL